MTNESNPSASDSALNTPFRAPIQTAHSRGERLHPPRYNRIYWLLTELRIAYEEIIAKFLSNHADATLVDYGCGNMPYRPLFPIENYIGADFEGNEQAEVLYNPDCTLPLPDGHASVVLSSQVLEHVAEVDVYLAEAHRVLAQDGLLLLSTHGVWRYHPDPSDFWRWTCDGLKKLIGESGFEVIHFHGVMGPEAAALQLWQDAVARRFPRVFRRIFYLYMQWRIRRASRRTSQEEKNRDACVFFVVARKS